MDARPSCGPPAGAATLVLRFDMESAAALVGPGERTESRWPAWISETLRAVEAVVRALGDFEAPASFFLVGELLRREGPSFAALLRRVSDLDVGNHTDSHRAIGGPHDERPWETFRRELRRASDEIDRHFGRRPRGFTAPGGLYRGLRGKPGPLNILWQEGYRYVTTDARASPQAPPHAPAPMTQPYWYDDEGFPELLELPITGWHCNLLFNTGGQNDDWTPAPGLPDGGILERLPQTVEEGFAVRKREFEYAVERRLIYAPCMHPWSLFRFDPEMEHLRRLIAMARRRGVAVQNCRQVYERYRAKREGFGSV